MNNNIEIKYQDIFLMIKKNIKLFLTTICILTILPIIISFFLDNYYLSYISIYQNNSNPNSEIEFGGNEMFAEMMGFNFKDTKRHTIDIIDFIESNQLQHKIILKKWHSKFYKDSVNLIDYWEIADFKGKIFSNNIFKKKLNNKEIEILHLEEAVEELEDRIIIDKKEDTGLIKISVIFEERHLSSEIVNYIGHYIKDYIANEINYHSTNYRLFIQDRLENSLEKLKNSEVELLDFQKKFPISFNTPELEMKRSRLVRNVELNQEIFTTLSKQSELAEIEELREKPIINILDYATPSIKRHSPKRKLIAIFAFILSLILSFLFVVVKETYINRKP